MNNEYSYELPQAAISRLQQCASKLADWGLICVAACNFRAGVHHLWDQIQRSAAAGAPQDQPRSACGASHRGLLLWKPSGHNLQERVDEDPKQRQQDQHRYHSCFLSKTIHSLSVDTVYLHGNGGEVHRDIGPPAFGKCQLLLPCALYLSFLQIWQFYCCFSMDKLLYSPFCVQRMRSHFGFQMYAGMWQISASSIEPSILICVVTKECEHQRLCESQLLTTTSAVFVVISFRTYLLFSY